MTSYLNKENIARSRNGVEYHPLIPFLPTNAKVLFLGSFPPQRKRWCMDFYYPNFINDHWRIEGAVFFGDRHHFVDEEEKRFKLTDIIAFCQEKGLAFFDTSTAVRRLQDNASDKFLEVVEPTDIQGSNSPVTTASHNCHHRRESYGDTMHHDEDFQFAQSQHLCPCP